MKKINDDRVSGPWTSSNKKNQTMRRTRIRRLNKINKNKDENKF